MRPELDPDAANAAAFATTADTANAGSVLDAAFGYLDSGRQQGLMTPLAAATFRRDRVAPPRLALLTDGIAPANVVTPTLTPIVPVVTPPLDTAVAPPVVTSFLAGGTLTLQRQVVRTTIAGLPGSGEPIAAAVPGGGQTAAGTGGTAQAASVPQAPAPTLASVPRVPAPTLASVTAGLDPALAARLRFTAPLPQAAGVTAAGGAGGLAATDGGPVTRRAGAPAEAHALPGLDSGTAALLAAHQVAFTGQGTTLRPGDVLVATLSNYGLDLDATGPRPTVLVTGDAAVRVVALSALGEVLADQTANQAEVEVPQHTARLAAWCVGGQAGAGLPGAATAASAGMTGWSATDLLPYVGAGVSLARDCVVAGLPRAAPQQPQRAGWTQFGGRPRRGRAGHPDGTPGRDVGRGGVARHHRGGRRVRPDGRHRRRRPRVHRDAGALAAPVVVAARGRTHLLYDLAGGAPAADKPGPVTVSVGTSPSWRLAGVMGGIGTAATTAPLLAASGAAHLLAPLLQAPTGSAQLRWSMPHHHHRARRPRTRRRRRSPPTPGRRWADGRPRILRRA